MNPFLQQLARTYIAHEAENIMNCCFVFPNRRSCSFFKKYLQEEAIGKALIFPETTTISDFVSSQSGLIEASRIELLMVLFQEFSKLTGKPQSFDNFLFWGDMILNDFNDVDRFMVDAKELFTNLTNFKNIESNYQTEEQLKVIRDFWGTERQASDSESFWNREGCKSSFFHLWSYLFNLYANFNQVLADRKLAYSGMNYREAAKRISGKGKDEFLFKRIVFVGFSTLSNAEVVIFKKFQNLGIGDYYWDFESPFMKGNKGAVFLKKYIREYPSRYDITQQDVPIPKINIVAVPSGNGQGQIVHEIIGQLIDSGEIADADNAIDTAIVLPEEKYLNSVLHSIPESIGALNITMGYPFAQTPIVSFISQLATLNGRKRVLNDETGYFYDDVDAIVSHPYVKAMCPNQIRTMLKEAKKNRLFFVPQSFLARYVPDLSFIFRDVKPDTSEAFNYVDAILAAVNALLSANGRNSIERYFVSQYQVSLRQLQTAIGRYGIKIEHQSILFLLSRSMAGAAIAFDGEPLKGLQVMGVLETRLLDFKNLVVLSMNEKVFPTKHYTRSFIPNFLRSGYGMATYEYQDAMYAYYFYRMISRAKNVYLLYDSRSQGLSSGEESRYIYQLDKVYNRNRNRRIIYKYNVKTPEAENIQIEKDQRVMSILDKYRQEGSERCLSASSINSYIECPLRFYLNTIEGIREEDEVTDFIDSATFGTIVHSIFEQVYNTVPTDKATGEKRVEQSFYSRYLTPNGISISLQKIISSTINKEYNHAQDLSRPLSGDSLLISSIISSYIKSVLLYDRNLCPFVYVGSEIKKSFHWQLQAGSETPFNFKYIIDRIDKVDGMVRIVDYKTGGDELETDSISDLFNQNSSGKHKKAILQLLLYCNAYAASNGIKQGIKPVIYKLRDINLSGKDKFDIKLNHEIIDNYLSTGENDAFLSEVGNVIDEMFNPTVPFRQTEHEKNCQYCQFIELCGRS